MKMRAWILYFVTLLSLPPLPGQEVVTALRHPVTGGGSAPSYVSGQNCTGGSGGFSSTVACTATFTVSIGDEIVVGTSTGLGTATISSCGTNSGTATVTWAVNSAASNIHDTTNAETTAICIGHVTGAGTVEPIATWSTGTGDQGIVAADFSASNNTIDVGVGQANAGSSATNGNTSGTITTTVNHDALISLVEDSSGTGATISAGTTSVTFAKIICTTSFGGQDCLEWGQQTAAASGTKAAWTFNNTDRNLVSMVALEP